MSTSPYFSIKWNHHSFNLPSFVSELFLSKSFADVTLSAEGHLVKAHKLILSLSSVYFHKLLFENPCSHPLLILKDVSFVELKSIVQFMYTGKLSVSTESLSGLYKTANELQIKGLLSRDNSETNARIVKPYSFQRVSKFSEFCQGFHCSHRDSKCSSFSLQEISSIDSIGSRQLKKKYLQTHSNDSERKKKNFKGDTISMTHFFRKRDRNRKREKGSYRQKLTGFLKMSKEINVNNSPNNSSSSSLDESDEVILSETPNENSLQFSTPRIYTQETSSFLVENNNSNNNNNKKTKMKHNSVIRFEDIESSSPIPHVPKARGGPALGCNYCWNTTDKNGRTLRRKTKYHCFECRANLCIVPCFQAYHEGIV